MESILRLKEVSKAYKKSDFRLEQISFSVPYGGFSGEMGGRFTVWLEKTERENPRQSDAF